MAEMEKDKENIELDLKLELEELMKKKAKVGKELEERKHALALEAIRESALSENRHTASGKCISRILIDF